MKHLLFFDATCSFCQHSVGSVLKWDRNRLFCFAPLGGKTADKWFTRKRSSLPFLNSLILVEDFEGDSPRTWIRAQAVFRIFWLIGGFFKPLGLLCFFPGVVINPLYCLVARFRSCLSSSPTLKKDHTRFLK